MDIQGAFDNVVPSILVTRLIELGLPRKICWFICQLTSFRNIQFVINGKISKQYVSYKGIPQGSILSPLLFNLYFSKCSSFLTRNCNIVQFADDIALFVRTANLVCSLRSLERSAGWVSDFLSSLGLSVSPAKSALMIFSRGRIDPLGYSISLNGSTIESVLSLFG